MHRLRVLNLKGNRLGDNLLKPILTAAGECSTLEVLNVADNSMRSAKGVSEIVKNGMNAVVDLDLGWNGLRGVDVIKDLVEALQSPKCILQTLRLAYNGFGSGLGDSMLLTALAESTTVNNIDLSFNVLDDRTALAYLTLLFPAAHGHVKSFNMSGNPIGLLGLRKALQVIGENTEFGEEVTLFFQKCNLDKNTIEKRLNFNSPSGAYTLNLEHPADHVMALELLRLGRKGGPLSFGSNTKVGKTRLAPALWYDDPYWEPPKTGTMTIDFEISATALIDTANHDSIRTAVITRKGCIACIDDEVLQRQVHGGLANRKVVERLQLTKCVKVLAEDNWFLSRQMHFLIKALAHNEEERTQMTAYLLPKLADAYDISTLHHEPSYKQERLESDGVETDDHSANVPHVLQLVRGLSPYGVSRLIVQLGFSPCHQSGHYELDLSLTGERDQAIALLALDMMQSFYWKKQVVLQKERIQDFGWGAIHPSLGPSVNFVNMQRNMCFSQRSGEWTCIRNAAYVANPAANGEETHFVSFTRSWALPERGVLKFDFVDAPTHMAFLQEHLPRAVQTDIEELQEVLRRSYRMLHHQEVKRGGDLEMDERDAFFKSRILGVLAAWCYTLTCLQLTQVLSLVAHGEHHHGLHPHLHGNADDEAYEKQFKVNRDHHVSDVIFVMLPKLSDLNNFHLPLVNLPKSVQTELINRIGALRLFNVHHPFQHYELSLDRDDDRKLAQLLIDMMKDPGSGLQLVANECFLNDSKLSAIPDKVSPLKNELDTAGILKLSLAFPTTTTSTSKYSANVPNITIKGLAEWETAVETKRQEEERHRRMSGAKKWSPKVRKKSPNPNKGKPALADIHKMAMQRRDSLGSNLTVRMQAGERSTTPAKWFNICNVLWVGIHEEK
jgi:hypothetical protein